MKDYLIAIAILLSVFIASGIAYIQSSKFILHLAVQGCMQAGTNKFDNPEAHSGAIIPDKTTYEFCMKEKGQK